MTITPTFFVFSTLILFSFLSFFMSVSSQTCRATDRIVGKDPRGNCNRKNYSECCRKGEVYKVFKCSPQVTHHTNAILTLNSFQKGGDGGSESACDGKFHNDNEPVVALSTGWFNKRKRCLDKIVISGNRQSVIAKVVDECDSTAGCDREHSFQPPCANNIVDASKAVWMALKVPKKKWGYMKITWTDL